MVVVAGLILMPVTLAKLCVNNGLHHNEKADIRNGHHGQPVRLC